MTLVLFILVLALIVLRLIVLTKIFMGKLARQTVDRRTQSILVADLTVGYMLVHSLAGVTHSTLTTIVIALLSAAYMMSIAVRFGEAYGEEYKPTVGELALYAFLQVILLFTCVGAVWA